MVHGLILFSIFFFGLASGFCLRHVNKAYYFWKKEGTIKLLKKALKFLIKKCYPKAFPTIQKDSQSKDISIKYLFHQKFVNQAPIQHIKVSRENFRLNIVLDSLQKNSFFGGIATSLVLATLFAKKFNIPLRIITRFSNTNPNDYFTFLSLVNIEKPGHVEFFSDFERFSDFEPYEKIDVSDKDIFLATSWWSVNAIKSINYRPKTFYILQEYEPLFYPNGDERIMSEDVLNDTSLYYFVDSYLLYDFYKKHDYANVINNSLFFNPAFPDHMYFANENSFKPKSKRKLFFYARPDHPRNLYYTGLKFLDEALLNGVIDDTWDIYFAGSVVEPVKFTNGYIPILKGQMQWHEYLDFVRDIDVCFSLMYTPHPSYPPLDVAKSGGVVLTNRYENKTSINYSDNIICVDLNEESVLEGFKRAILLSQDSEKRKKQYVNHRFETSWEDSFSQIIQYMYEHK